MSKGKTLLDAMAGENKSLAELLGMEENGASDNIDQLKAMAESGNETAMQLLGLKYLKGDGVPQDTMEAMYWLEKCNSSVAFFSIAEFYKDNGDKETAEEWYLKTINAGDSFVCNSYLQLALMHMSGEDKNLDKTAKYLNEAFSTDLDEESEKVLYDLCGLAGKVIGNSDPEKAAGLLKKALTRGENEDVRKALESAYEKVLIKSENFSDELKKDALTYFEAKGNTATTSNAFAMYAYYRKGDDAKKEFYWLEQAAIKGQPLAQLFVAREYLGPNYNSNSKMKFELDLEKCKKYLEMFDNNPAKKEDDLKTADLLRKAIATEENAAKKKTEKHVTEEVATELMAECRKSGGKILRIPDGYTHIDCGAFSDYYDRKPRMKELKNIEEVIFPDSLRVIQDGAFSDVCKLTKINLPPHLEYFGSKSFDGDTLGLFNRYIKDKRTVEKLVFPGNCKVVAGSVWSDGNSALRGIGAVKELIFEEGHKEINCNIFYDTKIGYLYIPDSVKTLTCTDVIDVKIETLSAPAHLKDQVAKLNRIKINRVEYR